MSKLATATKFGATFAGGFIAFRLADKLYQKIKGPSVTIPAETIKAAADQTGQKPATVAKQVEETLRKGSGPGNALADFLYGKGG